MWYLIAYMCSIGGAIHAWQHKHWWMCAVQMVSSLVCLYGVWLS